MTHLPPHRTPPAARPAGTAACGAAAAGAPALLHNIGVPPRSVVCRSASHRPALGRRTGFLLDLPPIADVSPAALLARLDGRPCGLGPEAAADELRRRIDRQAANLPLPPAAAVCDARWPNDPPDCADLLPVLAVLAKAPGPVYLRDREPNLAAIRPGRRVIVHVPANWRPS